MSIKNLIRELLRDFLGVNELPTRNQVVNIARSFVAQETSSSEGGGPDFLTIPNSRATPSQEQTELKAPCVVSAGLGEQVVVHSTHGLMARDPENELYYYQDAVNRAEDDAARARATTSLNVFLKRLAREHSAMRRYITLLEVDYEEMKLQATGNAASTKGGIFGGRTF